jgi:hypothetical protein
VPTKKFRIAAVVRNLLFDQFPVLNPPLGAEEEMGPGTQIRLGLGYVSGEKTVTGVDLDLTTNRVMGAERKTRGASLGYERWMSSWLALRSGTTWEFDGEGLIFALGTAVRLPFLSVDIGGRINRNGGFDEIVGGATLSF